MSDHHRYVYGMTDPHWLSMTCLRCSRPVTFSGDPEWVEEQQSAHTAWHRTWWGRLRTWIGGQHV